MTAPESGQAAPAEVERTDVVVAELDAATASHLFRAARLGSVPLVIATRFATFLPALGDRYAAVVRKPLVRARLLDAMGHALAGRPRIALDPPHWPDAPLNEAPVDPELYAIAELVSRGVGAKAGLVTVLSDDRQIFARHVGLPPDLPATAGMPRAWSICHHTDSAAAPLVVSDLREHPAVADNPSVAMNLLRAYAGVPIEIPGHGAVGTVCAISLEPRAFSARDLATLEVGASLAGARLAVHLAPRPAPPKNGGEERMFDVGDLVDGKFYVTGRLGDGGQSNVFFARDRLTGQLVAIKVVRAPIGEGSLVREATALSRVRHPNVVQSAWLGSHGGRSVLSGAGVRRRAHAR